MKKNYILFTLLLVFALQLTTVSAQTKKLTFKELLDQTYYLNIADAMRSPQHVYRLQHNVNGDKKLPADLLKLQNLQMLSLSGNTRKLDWELAIQELAKIKSLQYVYFQDSGLQALPPQIFTLAQLKGLGVINTNVSVLPADVSKLANLEYLVLINNRISVLPVQTGSLKNLKVLYLDGNNISVFPPPMANLKKLEELGIADNPIKNEEMKKIRKYYPNAKIIESYEPASVIESID